MERRRIMLAAFGDPGHAFPAIALGRALVARGHEVCLETWSRWQEHVEREGMRFAAAPEASHGLPALRRTASRVLEVLRQRWPATPPLPLYPAFRQDAPRQPETA